MKYEVFVTAYTTYKYIVEAEDKEKAMEEGEAMYKNDAFLDTDTSEEHYKEEIPCDVGAKAIQEYGI